MRLALVVSSKPKKNEKDVEDASFFVAKMIIE
jgi:hypothetical protein